MKETLPARRCERLCVSGTCDGCETQRARIQLEQAYRRREAIIATRKYLQSLCDYVSTSVDLVKAYAVWIQFEMWH